MPWSFAPEGDAPDPGVAVTHPSFGEDEVIVLKSVLTDAVVDEANRAATQGEEYRPGVYRDALIKLAVKEFRVKGPGGAYVPLTDGLLRRMSPQLKNWLVAEINKCDGSVAPAATIEIEGVPVPFRPAAGSRG